MNNCTGLSRLIREMSDGDDEFSVELIAAIYNGLQELKSVYAQGIVEMNETKIQQIRHKTKPTLVMFEFDDLATTIQEGKEILENQGFGAAFEAHFLIFQHKMQLTLDEVGRLADQTKLILTRPPL